MPLKSYFQQLTVVVLAWPLPVNHAQNTTNSQLAFEKDSAFLWLLCSQNMLLKPVQ